MDIYSDYGNWKFENFSLIDELVKLNSHIISRFSHVILITDYFYNKRLEKGNDLSTEDESIFQSAFNYIFEHFTTISLILNKVFNGNIKEMDHFSKSINLLLYTNDFQSELYNTEQNETEAMTKLTEFEQKVLSFIEQKKEIPDTMFQLLNDLTYGVFDEYYSTNEILYDIAVELDIIPENENEFDEFVFDF